MVIDEKRYFELAEHTLARVLRAFDQVDTDDADLDVAGDVISMRFRDGTRAVLNTQRPTRQLWLAGDARAWHFGWDEATGTWLDDKGTGAELLTTIAALARRSAGIELSFSPAEAR